MLWLPNVCWLLITYKIKYTPTPWHRQAFTLTIFLSISRLMLITLYEGRLSLTTTNNTPFTKHVRHVDVIGSFLLVILFLLTVLFSQPLSMSLSKARVQYCLLRKAFWERTKWSLLCPNGTLITSQFLCLRHPVVLFVHHSV